MKHRCCTATGADERRDQGALSAGDAHSIAASAGGDRLAKRAAEYLCDRPLNLAS